MSNIRSIVRKHQEEQSLRAYLRNKYDTTSDAEKKRLLEFVKDQIESEVDSILNAFIRDVQKGSPERKRRNKLALVNLIITAIATPGIAYGVNLENWIMVILFSLVLLTYQIYMITFE